MENQDEIYMTTPELIKYHGYIPEIHHIWTEDDYGLDMHRVLPSNDKVSATISCHRATKKVECYVDAKSKVPVLIIHGLLCSSADWVLLGSNKALAYVLTDNEFDVWLGNTRGNTYSKRHRYYSVLDTEFWHFSLDEIGIYDLPAMIDYILYKTGHSKLYYIGYSQGTTVFYIMGSERPEYNDKIKGMISLSPVAYLSNQKSLFFKYLTYFYHFMKWGSKICNINQWFPSNKWQTHILNCLINKTPNAVTKSFCNYSFYLFVGLDNNHLDKSMLPLICGHWPSGASSKQIFHYLQLLISESFQKYDYGPKQNQMLYGSKKPPQYNLTKIKTPMVIFHSDNDFLAQPIDVQKLVKKLPNVREIHKIPKYNHMDYMWSYNAKTILYNNIVKILKKL